jgi:hypothetical protein
VDALTFETWLRSCDDCPSSDGALLSYVAPGEEQARIDFSISTTRGLKVCRDAANLADCAKPYNTWSGRTSLRDRNFADDSWQFVAVTWKAQPNSTATQFSVCTPENM